MSISGTILLLVSKYHPPLAIPFLGPKPVFEIKPQGLGLRASPCRRPDSGQARTQPVMSARLWSCGFLSARGMVPRLPAGAKTDVPQRCTRLRVDDMRRPLAATLMVSVIVFQAGDGTFGAVPADEIDGDEVSLIVEIDPWA